MMAIIQINVRNSDHLTFRIKTFGNSNLSGEKPDVATSIDLGVTKIDPSGEKSFLKNYLSEHRPAHVFPLCIGHYVGL